MPPHSLSIGSDIPLEDPGSTLVSGSYIRSFPDTESGFPISQMYDFVHQKADRPPFPRAFPVCDQRSSKTEYKMRTAHHCQNRLLRYLLGFHNHTAASAPFRRSPSHHLQIQLPAASGFS